MSSSLIAPYLIYQPFGVAASNPTYINLPIPQPDQTGITVNAASFTTGFPPSTMTPEVSGGLPFFGQDMNGILYMITAYCANFAAGALSSYNSTLSSNLSGYPLGAVLVNAAGNALWVSQVDGNVTDPDSGGAGWAVLAASSGDSLALTGGTIALTAAQWSYPYLVFQGALLSNAVVEFPDNQGQQWLIVNICTGGFTLTCKTVSGTGVTIPATGYAAPSSIYCGGSGNIYNTGISTAGLAPLNSPGLTGTPTAPTASPATTNTTQIATTAFTQAAITAALALYATKASPIFSGTPTAPTAAQGTNTLQLATTAFVNTAAPDYRAGTFASANGVVAVAFSSALLFVPLVIVTPNYASPDYGWVVPGSITTAGFQYQSGNAGTMQYYAVKPR